MSVRSKDRHRILTSLLTLDRPLEDILEELRAVGWGDDAVVVLTVDHLRAVLGRYREGTLSAGHVEAWANAVEGRDDIDIEERQHSLITEVLFELANPALQGPLSTDVARRWMDRLRPAGAQPGSSDCK